MSSDLWIGEVECVEEDLSAGRIDVAQAKVRLIGLGFDPDEADEHVSELVA